MKYFNAHTHIFTAQFVPNNVVGIPIMNMLARFPISRRIVNLTRYFFGGKMNGKLQRIVKFAEIGLGKSQEVIFNELQDYYQGWGDMRFVVLMMDMEQMGAGIPLSNYQTQLDEIIRLRSKGNYADVLLPFIAIDPRRPEFSNGQILLDWVKGYFDKYGFVGIKMYPALGYYPFDEKLDELYAWAEKTKIPIMYHCIEGVIHYRGPLNGFPPPRFSSKFHNLNETDPQKYQRNFTEPDNYHHVLKMFPKLKICLGHYGGDDEMMKASPNWYTRVRELVCKHEYVYTDVSFTLNNTAIFQLLHNDINDPNSKDLGDRILFGTDFFVVEKNKDEAELRDELRDFLMNADQAKGISISSFDRIASENPSEFLTSWYYTA